MCVAAGPDLLWSARWCRRGPAQAGRSDGETHVSSLSHGGSGLRGPAKNTVGAWYIPDREPLAMEPGCFGKGQGFWDWGLSTSLPGSLESCLHLCPTVSPAEESLARSCCRGRYGLQVALWTHDPAHRQTPLVLGTPGTMREAPLQLVPGALQLPLCCKCRSPSLQEVSTSGLHLRFTGPGSPLPTYPQGNALPGAKGPIPAFPLQSLPDPPEAAPSLLWVPLPPAAARPGCDHLRAQHQTWHRTGITE